MSGSNFRVPQASMVPYGSHRDTVHQYLISQAKGISDLLDSITRTNAPTGRATDTLACNSILRFVTDTENFNFGRSGHSQLAGDVRSRKIAPTFATAVQMWKEMSQNTGLDESLRAWVRTPDQSTDMPVLDVPFGADGYDDGDAIHVKRCDPRPTITVSSTAIADEPLASQGKTDDVEAREAVLGHRGKVRHRLSVGSATGGSGSGVLSDLPVRDHHRRKTSGGGSGVSKSGHRKRGSQTSVSLTSPGRNQNTSTVQPSDDETIQLDEPTASTSKRRSLLQEMEELIDTPSSHLPQYDASLPRLRRRNPPAGEESSRRVD